MSFSKFNRAPLFDINSEGFEYYKLSELFAKDGNDYVYPVRAIYINKKGMYEPSPIIATDDCFVNLPSHMTDVCMQILTDAEAIESIKQGQVGFKIYEYTNKKYGTKCYNIEWIDVTFEDFDPLPF